MEKPMPALVIGAGAIGCLLAARMAEAGVAVTLVTRPERAPDLRRTGVRLTEADGRVVAPNINIVGGASAALARGNGFDLGVIAVKAYDTASVGHELAEAGWAGNLLTVQNGVGNEETLAANLRGTPILAGALTTPVEVLAPGQVRVARATFHCGLAPGPESVALGAVVNLFATIGFKTRTYSDYRALKWSKLLMNILANAQSAILGFTPAQIVAEPALAALEVRAWREALVVMKTLRIKPVSFGGYPLPIAGTLIRWLPIALVRPILARFIAGGRGRKMPSLYYDLHPQPRLALRGRLAKRRRGRRWRPIWRAHPGERYVR